MAMYHFTEVGRRKQNVSFAAFDGHEAARKLAKSGLLMSRDIELWIDDDMVHGDVVVGGFRTVGRFRVEQTN